MYVNCKDDSGVIMCILLTLVSLRLMVQIHVCLLEDTSTHSTTPVHRLGEAELI